MIAKIEKPFNMESLVKKSEYHQQKIDNGVAELFITNGYKNINGFLKEMNWVVEYDTNATKNKYIEFSLNLNKGERLDKEIFQSLAKEYLKEMGYENAHYIGIIHSDKEHSHIHLLASIIDMDGKRISNSFDFAKSEKISRQLEIKYGLKKTVYNKFNNQALGEVKHREYYFHKAFHKAIKNHVTLEMLKPYLDKRIYEKIDFNKPRTNAEYEKIFGDNYNTIGKVLEEKKHFNPLYKEELLKAMDKNYAISQNISEFQRKMQADGYYMRLIKSEFVYGIPGASFYIKEKSMPQTYRFSAFKENGMITVLSEDLQKNYIYNHAYNILSKTNSFEEFKDEMFSKNIRIIEGKNKQGGVKLSFVYTNGEGKMIAGSDISSKLTYENIEKHFNGEKSPLNVVFANDKAMEQIQESVYLPKDYNNRNENDNLNVKKKKKKNIKKEREY